MTSKFITPTYTTTFTKSAIEYSTTEYPIWFGIRNDTSTAFTRQYRAWSYLSGTTNIFCQGMMDDNDMFAWRFEQVSGDSFKMIHKSGGEYTITTGQGNFATLSESGTTMTFTHQGSQTIDDPYVFGISGSTTDYQHTYTGGNAQRMGNYQDINDTGSCFFLYKSSK